MKDKIGYQAFPLNLAEVPALVSLFHYCLKAEDTASGNKDPLYTSGQLQIVERVKAQYKANPKAAIIFLAQCSLLQEAQSQNPFVKLSCDTLAEKSPDFQEGLNTALSQEKMRNTETQLSSLILTAWLRMNETPRRELTTLCQGMNIGDKAITKSSLAEQLQMTLFGHVDKFVIASIGRRVKQINKYPKYKDEPEKLARFINALKIEDSNSAPLTDENTSQLALTASFVYVGSYLEDSIMLEVSNRVLKSSERVAKRMLKEIEKTPVQGVDDNHRASHLITRPGVNSPIHTEAKEKAEEKSGWHCLWEEIEIKPKADATLFKINIDALSNENLITIQEIAKGKFGQQSRSKPFVVTYDSTEEGDVSRITFKNKDAARNFLKELNKAALGPAEASRPKA